MPASKISWRDVLNAKTTYAHQAIPMARALGYPMFAWAGIVYPVPTFGTKLRAAICMAGELR